jgi:hypothetical protein
MNKIIHDKIEAILKELDSQKYNRICEKIKFEEGKKLVINMIYSSLEDFPSFSLENAITDVEIQLKGLENE